MSYEFGSVEKSAIVSKTSFPQQELGVISKSNEVCFVCTNPQNLEICNLCERNDNCYNASFDRTVTQNKALQQLCLSNYNKFSRSIFQKISPILKNEICTRAP